jgi:MFS transporter, ACS family, D-galactonate transporter
VIGVLVDATGSFVAPLGVIGVIALVGAFNYLVILGKVEPLAVTARGPVASG